jgi:exopolyphosphatase / guanosine-5'-triphosphate,3'-diphosphate pyrophosphatase
MELARIGKGKVGKRVDTPLGPFRLQQIKGGPKSAAPISPRAAQGRSDDFKPEGQRIYLVGGSWRVIARLDMERRNYPLTVLHEYRMTPQGRAGNARLDRRNDLTMLRARTGTSAERMELVPLACEVLRELVTMFARGNRRLLLRHPRGAALRTDARSGCAPATR